MKCGFCFTLFGVGGCVKSNSKNTGSGIYLHSKNWGRQGLCRIKSPCHICEASCRTKANKPKQTKQEHVGNSQRCTSGAKVTSWALKSSWETSLLEKILRVCACVCVVLFVMVLVRTTIFTPCVVVGNVSVSWLKKEIRDSAIHSTEVGWAPLWCTRVRLCVYVCVVSVCFCASVCVSVHT